LKSIQTGYNWYMCCGLFVRKFVACADLNLGYFVQIEYKLDALHMLISIRYANEYAQMGPNLA